jgi:hypothetical protein
VRPQAATPCPLSITARVGFNEGRCRFADRTPVVDRPERPRGHPRANHQQQELGSERVRIAEAGIAEVEAGRQPVWNSRMIRTIATMAATSVISA